MKDLFTGKKIIIFVIIVISAFRFFDLEKDPPAYNISGINVTDEPYYCLSGLEKYLKTENRLEEKLQVGPPDFFSGHNYFLTFFSLKAFGNTFIGFRAGVVLLSIIIIIILFYLFRRSQYYQSSFAWLFPVFIGFDFYFFLFSRYQTPQLYSIFWLTLSLLFVSFSEKQKLFIIPAAFVFFLSAAWVYPYTAFASAGFALWIFYQSMQTRSWQFIYYSMSGVVIAVLFLIFIFWLDNKTIDGYINVFLNFNNVRDETIKSGFSLKTAFTNFLQIPYTNLLRFNPFLLFVLVYGSFYCIQNLKKLPSLIIVSFFCILTAFMQSLFMNSYPFKKWIMIFPFIVVMVPMVYRETVSSFRSNKLLTWVSSLIVLFLGIQSIRINNLSLYWHGFSANYPFDPLPVQLQWVLYLSLLVIIACPVILFFSSKAWIRMMFLFFILLPGFSLNTYYLFDKKRIHKDMLGEIGRQTANHKSLIAGDFSHAYVFYNSAIPSYNPYAHLELPSYPLLFGERMNEIDIPMIYIKKNLAEDSLPEFKNCYNREFRYFSGKKFGLYKEIAE